MELPSVSWPGFGKIYRGWGPLPGPARKELVYLDFISNFYYEYVKMMIKIKMRVVQRKEAAHE